MIKSKDEPKYITLCHYVKCEKPIAKNTDIIDKISNSECGLNNVLTILILLVTREKIDLKNVVTRKQNTTYFPKNEAFLSVMYSGFSLLSSNRKILTESQSFS